MKTYTINDGITTYTRISKRVARRRFHEGKNVYVIACKMRPERPFSMGCVMYGECFEKYRYDYTYKDVPLDDLHDAIFEHWLNEFSWYNCNYECGYYPAFYVESVDCPHCGFPIDPQEGCVSCQI